MIIVTIWFPIGRVFFVLYPSDLPVHGDYALEVMWEGVKFGRDAGIVRIGGKLNAGLARYRNDVGSRNNVIFIRKFNKKKICDIKILPGKTPHWRQDLCRLW